jgi:hypothetical protein
VRRAWLQHAVVNDTEGRAFWQQVRHRFDALRSAKKAGDIPKMATYSSAHFVFVFDECANFTKEEYVMCSVSRTVSTVSTMSHIRSALREIRSIYNCNLLGLFIDTDAEICQLTPPPDRPVVLSPSFCQADMPKPQLAFPPVGMLPMCNLEKTDSMMTHTLHYAPLGRGIDDDTDTGVKVLFCPETLVLLSRPMFAMHVHRRTVDTMVPIANYKLLNGIHITKPCPLSHDLDLASLAVLGCRFGLSSTNTRHKQLLVRNHLATCFDMSPYGKDLVVGYQSEPLLAEAAAVIMQWDRVLPVVLETLYRLVVRGSLALSSGNRDMGELIVCITLSRAFDRACARLHSGAGSSRSRCSFGAAAIAARISNSRCPTFGRPIPLVEVLVELYGGSDPVKADQTRQDILAVLAGNALCHGIVMFNHFIKSSNDPIRDVASYKALLRRGAAVVYTHGEAAKNIVIPVALPKAPDCAIDLWDSDSYVLTTWEIHVNNWQAASHVRRNSADSGEGHALRQALGDACVRDGCGCG